MVKKLEDILLYYGVNLPERFGKNIFTPETKERFKDDFIFKDLFLSMVDAVTLEGLSMQEMIINQDIRTMIHI